MTLQGGGWRAACVVGMFACAPALSPPACHASTEEFASFDVVRQEEDDESLLDHVLTSPPWDWRDEWERAPQAFRTAQGCLTSGQWFVVHDLKLASPAGRRARFGLELRQVESDVQSFETLDLVLRVPTRWGTPGARFRPLHDKSRQDFALSWEVGAETTAVQVQAVFTFEDLFNNLWAFRQTRVGDIGEPYERHPWEPALRVAWRRAGWRADVSGVWLTPSRKRITSYAAVVPEERRVTLWGAHGEARFGGPAPAGRWEILASNLQAASTDVPLSGSPDDAGSFRRQWRVETAWRAEVARRLEAEARWLYAERTQSHDPPLAPYRFGAVDRLGQLELVWKAPRDVRVRLGALLDRISVAATPNAAYTTYGTRTESRAYVGLAARFGRVRVSGVEGIELDREPYDVWFVHDKGFLHLQTTF